MATKPKRARRKGIVRSPPHFEAPGPRPPGHPDMYDWEVRKAIHTAMHINDPSTRTRLAHHLSRRLLAGDPLIPAEREWLSWLLERLVDKDLVPHYARGNTVTSGRSDRIQRLFQAMQQSPRRGVTAQLHDVSKTLNRSYETVRDLYYSEDFRPWKASLARSKQSPDI